MTTARIPGNKTTGQMIMMYLIKTADIFVYLQPSHELHIMYY